MDLLDLPSAARFTLNGTVLLAAATVDALSRSWPAGRGWAWPGPAEGPAAVAGRGGPRPPPRGPGGGGGGLRGGRAAPPGARPPAPAAGGGAPRGVGAPARRPPV